MEEENKSENYYEREYNEKYDTYDYVNDAKKYRPQVWAVDGGKGSARPYGDIFKFYRGYTGNSNRRNLYE